VSIDGRYCVVGVNYKPIAVDLKDALIIGAYKIEIVNQQHLRLPTRSRQRLKGNQLLEYTYLDREECSPASRYQIQTPGTEACVEVFDVSARLIYLYV